MRINARLDDESSLKLEYLQRQTEKSVTEIIKSALDTYYKTIVQSDPIDVLKKSGFIGCGEADSNLSIQHKAELAGELGSKYG
ncbi:MAG: CopG family transcriptional regulator [Cyanobacteria bacterium P01_A01_bin.17]